MPSKSNASSQPISSIYAAADDDDFQIPLTQAPKILTSTSKKPKTPFKPSNNSLRPSKKPKPSGNSGKENVDPAPDKTRSDTEFHFQEDENCSLESIPSSIDCSHTVSDYSNFCSPECGVKKDILKINDGYLLNSVESRLLRSRTVDCSSNEDFEEGAELDVLLKLCEEVDVSYYEADASVQCPLCGIDISDLSEELRQVHTNDCLDKCDNQAQDVVSPSDNGRPQAQAQVGDGSGQSLRRIVDVSPVVQWLQSLGLAKYEQVFVCEEIDWDTLQWLTEEDLINMGVTALGPRKKIVHALSEVRKGCPPAVEEKVDANALSSVSRSNHASERQNEASKIIVDGSSKPAANKLITDFFPGSVTDGKKVCTSSSGHCGSRNSNSGSGRKPVTKHHARNGKFKDIPSWCSVPGTPFRVRNFLRMHSSISEEIVHIGFSLTFIWTVSSLHHLHYLGLTLGTLSVDMPLTIHGKPLSVKKLQIEPRLCDYQGLTRSFCHGKIYCSLITARLVNLKIGIPWERLHVLPLNQKISIAGTEVTCLEANHCPGSIIILFEPPNGKAVLHTGDFRFSEEMASLSVLQTCPIHTLILDTTYCNPQYDFPKQEAVIQFVIEAIQAEAFNPKTLFLIGSYTIGKERLFLEVARVLRRKVYVNAAKFRLLQCLEFSEEDMQWFTMNDQESHIHVVPMWTLASFKRLKHLSNQYVGRFSLIVAFSPTGWTFSKGKKKSPGRRWQQGTVIRYEVPYSEHCSFTELKEFVKLASPENIIPSVNNDGPDSANAMVSLLLS
ncbi:hypothetical protein JRO89_XS03G0300800 [Xanthoceras sorbifolium]|uniref:SAM domain-containing protein n=1 Tax=Xanthoceras sorbifolium TaxID=99658 RepID=A0ABQ8ICT0_9ROSI|nr:hypothetical protein JRO89_XS03G0300800 [Xanthoceras sorbifolium]